MARDHFRAFARFAVDISATIISADGGWQRPGQLTNLGLGGACIESLEAVPTGTSVRIQLLVPQLWEPIALAGEVVWIRADTERRLAQMGVRFEHVDAAGIGQLLELLQSTAAS